MKWNKTTFLFESILSDILNVQVITYCDYFNHLFVAGQLLFQLTHYLGFIFNNTDVFLWIFGNDINIAKF